MPHIAAIDKDCAPIFTRPADNVGELTFQIQQCLASYLVHAAEQRELGSVRYTDLAQCLAALSGADADFRRQVLGPYEDAVIERNGDAWAPLRRAKVI